MVNKDEYVNQEKSKKEIKKVVAAACVI